MISIYINDLLSDENIVEEIMKQVLLAIGARRVILDHLLSNLCREINHPGSFEGRE